jgi:hypothetical protein
MQWLVSMRTIDMAISGSFNVSVVLGIVLDQVTGQLGSHAADILLFNQTAQTFKFSTGRGFRTQGLEHSSYKFGADLAWRIIRERRRVEVFDLKAQPNVLQRTPDLFSESFQSYIGVPLVTKGQVRGVLEVFHRDALNPDREWYSYLETLAGQAAIAVDNAALFEHMQNSNTELVTAYDSTLVGWADALELRSLEPEGHSRRVDNLSAQLAQALGLKDNDLVNIHRGALLHDIGKLGVPEGILLKPARSPRKSGRLFESIRKLPLTCFPPSPTCVPRWISLYTITKGGTAQVTRVACRGKVFPWPRASLPWWMSLMCSPPTGPTGKPGPKRKPWSISANRLV